MDLAERKEQNISACTVERYSNLGPPKYIFHCCFFNDDTGSLNCIAFNGKTIRQKLIEKDLKEYSYRLVGVTRPEVV
jgi:hypothetical protein